MKPRRLHSFSSTQPEPPFRARAPWERTAGLLFLAVCGLGSAAPVQAQVDPRAVDAYLDSVDALKTTVEWKLEGASRAQLNAERLRLTASWKRPGAGRPAVLEEAKLEAVGGRRLEIPGTGRRLRHITVWKDGGVRLRHSWMFAVDGRIRVKNGGYEIGLPFGIKVPISADVLGVRARAWPPTLGDLLAMVSARRDVGSGATGRAGAFVPRGVWTWTCEGTTRPAAVPLGEEGVVHAATTLSLKGRGRLFADGSFVSELGDENRVEVRLRARNARAVVRQPGGAVIDARVSAAQADYRGRYGLTLAQGRYTIALDGALSYELGAAEVAYGGHERDIRVGGITAAGDGRLSGRLGSDGLNLELRGDGLTADVAGPVRFDGALGGVRLEDLIVDGDLVASAERVRLGEGRLDVDGARVRGDLRTERGLVGAVGSPGAAASLDASRLGVDLVGAVRAGEGAALDARGRVRGHLAASAPERSAASLAASLEVDGDVALSVGTGRPAVLDAAGQVRGTVRGGGLPLPAGLATFDAEALEVTLDLDAAGGLGGLESARGSVRVRGDGRVDARGGPPTSTLSAPTTHTVAPGESLWLIAARYGSSVDQLRRWNGVPVDVSLIRPGQRLRLRPSEPAPRGLRGSGRVDDLELDLDVESARFGRDGSGELRGIVRGRATLGDVDLGSGRLEAALRGSGSAELRPSRVTLRRDAAGRTGVEGGELSVPIRYDLREGTRVQVAGVGEARIDRPGSFVQLTGVLADGRSSLEDVVLELHSSVIGELAGLARNERVIGSVNGDGVLTFRGRLELGERGLKLYGAAHLGVEGRPGEPLVELSW